MHSTYKLRGSRNLTDIVQEILFMNISSNDTFINVTSTIPADIGSDIISYTYLHPIVTFGLVFIMIYAYVHFYFTPPIKLFYNCIKKAIQK
jgi:hypothetical protein